jgi:U6 snRNA-associated Sm-like protein LSm7
MPRRFDASVCCCFVQAGRKETALDLAKFVDKGVQVKLTGGRQGWFPPPNLFYCFCVISMYTWSDPLDFPAFVRVISSLNSAVALSNSSVEAAYKVGF